MGKHKEVSCKICFKPMRSDNVTKHMKIHLKYTPKGDDLCKDIVLELVDNVVEQRSGFKRKYDEDDMQQTPEIKRNCHEAVEIDDEALRNIMIIQNKEYKHKRALGENV